MKKLSINVILALGQMMASAFIYLSLSFFLKDKLSIDCLLVALSIPSLFLVIWTGSISYQLTPVLVSQYADGQINIDFCKSLIVRLLTIIIALTVLLYALHPLIVKFMVPGFAKEKILRAEQLMGLSILLIPIQLSISTFNSLFITLRRNIFGAFVALIGNIVVICTLLVLRSEITAEKIIFSMLLGNIFTLTVYLVEYFRKYYKSPAIKKAHAFDFLKFLKELAIIVLILTASRSISLIQNAFGSNMKEGSITLLTYTNYITNIVITILITPILNVHYAKHCEWWNNHERGRLFKSFQVGIFILCLLFLVFLSFFLLSQEFLIENLAVLSQKISFDIDVNILRLLMLSTFCLVMSAFIGRIFYIGGYFKLINAIDLLAIFIYTCAGYFLSKEYGLVGLYGSFFLYALVGIFFYLIVLKRKMNFRMGLEQYRVNKKLIFQLLLLFLVSIFLSLLIKNTTLKTVIGVLVLIIDILFLFKSRKQLSLEQS